MTARTKVARDLGAVVVAAILLFACRQIVGIDDRTPQEPPATDSAPPIDTAPACGSVVVPAACRACLDRECCAEEKACADSEGCARYEACVGRCGASPKCRAQCVVDSKWFTNDATIHYDVCMAQHCAEECELKCGSAAALVEPANADDCEKCLVAGVCADWMACAKDLACQQTIWCHGGCRTFDCSKACDDPSNPGAATFATLGLKSVSCTGACKPGRYWACVDTMTWPLTESDKIHLTGNTKDFATDLFVVGEDVDVKACAAADMTCTLPVVASTKLTADGRALLDLSTGGPGLRGFLGHFELQPASPDWLPSLVFLDPLTRTNAIGPLRLLTRNELEAVTKPFVTLDPDHGHVIVVARDCMVVGADQVEVDISAASKDSMTKRAYMAPDGMHPEFPATGTLGVAAFVNVREGPTDVTIRPLSRTDIVGRRAIYVRRGATTFAYVGPTPSR